MMEKSGQGGVPVIVIDDQVVVGFDQRRLEQLLAAGAAPAGLGAAVADADKFIAGESGAYVGSVRPGSVAERAGLAHGDVIVELGGRPVQGADDLQALVGRLPRGAKLGMSWRRGGQPMRAEVIL